MGVEGVHQAGEGLDRAQVSLGGDLAGFDSRFQRVGLEEGGHELGVGEGEFEVGVLGVAVPGVQDAVADLEAVGVGQIGDVQVDREVMADSLGVVEPDGEVVEQDVQRHRGDGVVGRGLDAFGVVDAVAEFLGGGQEDVAPLRALGLVSELLERVGLQVPGVLVPGSANTAWETNTAWERSSTTHR